MKSTRLISATATTAILMMFASGCAAPEPEEPNNLDVSAFPEEIFSGLDGTLTWYDSSGGLTTDSKNETVWKNFTELTSIPVRHEFTDGTTTKFLAGAQNGNVPWNLLEIGTGAEYFHARDQGILEPIDTSLVPVELMQEGGVDEFGIEVEENGAILTWNQEALGSAKPSSSADIFDLESFPGKRCLYKYPVSGGVLESALYADGVSVEDIYPLDIDRALQKLETIKGEVIWWDSAATAMQLLNNGECSMAMMWSGRVYDAIEQQSLPLDFTWNGGVRTSAYFAVPKAAENKEVGFAAMAMWILDRQGQIDFVNKTTYTTAINDISISDYAPSVQPFLATGENLENAIVEDSESVADMLDELNDKMNAFLAG